MHKRNITRIRMRFFSVLILLLTGVHVFASDWASIVSETGPGIARIALTDSNGATISQGSGFMIETEPGIQYLVTNAHVVKQAQYDKSIGITAYFQYPSKSEAEADSYPAGISEINGDLDLCLLKIGKDAPVCLKLSDGGMPGLMDEILVIGYPLGKNFKTTPGYVQAFQDIEKRGTMIDLSASVAPGNSGGPVLDSDGQVVGIAAAVIPGYNFNLAIPVKDLISFISADTSTVALSVRSYPEQAWVFIDGNYKGKTPLNLELTNKSFSLRLEKEGYEPLEKIIGPWNESSSGEFLTLTEKITAEPFITITTEPSGASVSVNNAEIGISPVTVRHPSGRILRIRIKNNGYKEKLEFYTVTDEAEQELEIELEKGFLFW